MTLRVIAIDWSGALGAKAREKIWLAEVVDGSIGKLENGRDRQAIADFLVSLGHRDSALVAGLDFAFSFPSWFLEQLGLASAPELWNLAAQRGEEWLSSAKTPFWGRHRSRRPKLPAHFRVTETDLASTPGPTPKSVFQIGGAGAVGTGSIRGMPILKFLHEQGFSIWPFSPVNLPLVVEIYPRVLTGRVVKTKENARREYLRDRFPNIGSSAFELASSCEDAFDAAVSALVMYENLHELLDLPPARDQRTRLEGKIWYPRSRPALVGL